MKKTSAPAITTLLTLHGSLGRPLTFMEIAEALPEVPVEDVSEFLENGVAKKNLLEEDGFYWLKNYECGGMKRREQDFLLDRKWKKLMRLSGWFKHIPFIEFVFVSGSMSMGNVHDRSDFDVVTGVRAGRIFTTRYIVSALFSLLRARRLDDLQESSPDKLCFNHFVTQSTYEKEPHNYYRRELYRNRIPLWGSDDALNAFIARNKWADMRALTTQDEHRRMEKKSGISRTLEALLGGSFGNMIETRVARPIAMKRLAAYRARKGEGERVVITDEELEFHFELNYEKKFSGLTR